MSTDVDKIGGKKFTHFVFFATVKLARSRESFLKLEIYMAVFLPNI